MYAVTSRPLLRRTRATLRSAEFGFLGVVVYTRVQTPRFCGEPWSCWGDPFSEFKVHCRSGAFDFLLVGRRPLRISCRIVGTFVLLFLAAAACSRKEKV
jgi:hypothetical protein